MVRSAGSMRTTQLTRGKIEYLVVSFDDEKKEVKLSLRQAEILEALAKDEELLRQGGGVPDIAKGVVKYICLTEDI